MSVDKSMLDVMWLLICSGLVFVMQAGFLCLEAGLTRTKNSINVAVKNLSDFGVAALLFWLIGFPLMFGQSVGGLIGFSDFAIDLTKASAWDSSFFLYQVMFCGTAVTIISGAVAERMRFKAYLVVAAVVSTLIYPVFGHWAWGGVFDGGGQGWLKQLGFVDFAGSTVVHSIGGWTALALLLIIGPRVGRFDMPSVMRGGGVPFAMLGVLLLWFGWLGFNGGSVFAFDKNIPGIITNTVMAGAAGLIVVLLYSFVRHKIVKPELLITGLLAGLVAITAGCFAVSSIEAVMIGGIAALIALAADQLLVEFKIDDAVSAIPVHLGAGIWGTIAVALFGDQKILDTGLTLWTQLMVQGLGVFVCFVIGFVVPFGLFKLLSRLGSLRVSEDEERLGLNIVEHDIPTEIHDLVRIMDLQSKTQDLTLKAPEDSFSEVGQIAIYYNKVLDAFQGAVQKQTAAQHDLKKRSEELQTMNQSLSEVKTAMLNVLEDFENEKKHNELILNSAGEGIYGLDMLGRTTFVNPVALKMLGYESESELIGKPQHDLIHHTRFDGSPYKIEDCSIYAALHDGQIYHVSDEVFWRKDGTSFEVEYISTPIREEGKIVGAVVSFSDISERKKLEAQLQQSQKMEVVGQLAGGIAHDFNNLLMVIHGYSEFLLEDISKEDPKHGEVAEISKAASRARDLVGQLLAFSRKQIAKPQEVDLNAMLQEMEKMLDRLLGGGVELKLDTASDLEKTMVDPGQLEQVIINIALNAKDAMSEKGGDLTLKTSNISYDKVPGDYVGMTPGHYVCLQISDTGKGMSEEVCKKVFEPFFTTKGKHKGTGLGMATAYGIVKQNKGFLYLKSTEGVGTAFEIFFPKLKAFKASSHKTKQTSGSQKPKALPKGSEKVLLVEDEPSVRAFIAKNLRNLGYQVQEASNGQEALAEIKNMNGHKFDITLTDVIMPKMSGEDLWKEVTASHPDMKFIFMSGYTDDEDLRRRIAERKAPFLQKPFTHQILAQKLREVLDAKVGHG